MILFLGEKLWPVIYVKDNWYIFISPRIILTQNCIFKGNTDKY